MILRVILQYDQEFETAVPYIQHNSQICSGSFYHWYPAIFCGYISEVLMDISYINVVILQKLLCIQNILSTPASFWA